VKNSNNSDKSEKKDYQKDPGTFLSTRKAFGEALLDLGEKIPNLVVATANLAESTQVSLFAQKFPNRFVEVGVAEQNLAGVGAGLALSGKIPVITSFAVFSPGRNWDQIRISICYNNANVKIVSTHAGLSPSKDGATHESLEDLALTRVLPNLTIFSPCDYYETKKVLAEAVQMQGPVYIRLGREETPVITSPHSKFALGEIKVLEEGKRVALVGTGTILAWGLPAAQRINQKYKNSVKVINCPTIKPLNEKQLLDELQGINKVVTLEEHQISAGFGSEIAEIISEKDPKKIFRLGVKDSFGESGSYRMLLKKYKLDEESIERTLLRVLKE